MPWQAIAWAPVGGQPPSPHGGNGSKHSRSAYRTVNQKVYIAGGDRDGSDAGQPNIYSVLPGQGAFTLERATNAAGKQPAYPDNCTWAYDEAHDRFIIARSFWFGHDYAVSQQPARPDADWLLQNGIFDPNAGTYSSTVIPTPPTLGWGGDSNTNFGTYSRRLNALIRFYRDGAWGNTLQIIPLGDLTTFPTAVNYSVGSAHPSGSFLRGYIRDIDAHSRQIAIDDQNGKVYAITASGFNGEWRLLEVDFINAPTAGKIYPLPSTFDPQEVGAGDGSDNYLCFDTLRGRLMHPQVNGYGGEVKSTIISPPVSQLSEAVAVDWEVVPSLGPPYPQGNNFCWVPSLGAGMFHGGRATTSVLRPGEPMPVPTHYFLLTPGTDVPPLPVGKTVRDTLITVPVQVDASIVEDHYRISQHEVGNPTPIQTVITPSAAVNFGDFPNTIIGKAYDYRAVLETAANAAIGTPVITTLTASGEAPPDPPDPTDTTPPVVTINVPAPAQVLAGTIAWDYTVSDPAGIKTSEARVNGALVGATWDSTTLPNGDATFSVRAVDNSTNANETTVSVTFSINNPAPPDPPDPTPEPIPTAGTAALFVVPIKGHMGYVVWADVTNGREAIFRKTTSAWPGATEAEVAAVQAGTLAESSGILKDLNDATLMEQAVALKLAEWQADVAQKCASPLHNLFFNGDVWGVRA